MGPQRCRKNFRVARAKRAQDAQSSGALDPGSDPRHPLYTYIHMQEPPQPQKGGKRGTNDTRPPNTNLSLGGSEGAPRLYRADFMDRSKYFHSLNADGTAREVDHCPGPPGAFKRPLRFPQ